jgi:hypothetical protein
MRDCKKIHPLLSLYYMEKELPSSEQNRVDLHLKACPEARQELEDYKRLRAASLAMSEPKAPRDLHEKIMARVTGKVRPPARPNRFWAWAPAGFAAAAALLFLILNPLTQTKKTLVIAELPKALDEKTASSRAYPNNEASADLNANISQGSSNEVVTDLGNKPLVMAQAKKEMKSKRKAPSTPFVAMAGLNEPRAGNNTLALASKPVNASEAPMEAAPAIPAAASAMAPPTPYPTEGTLQAISLSKQITALTWTGNNAPATVENEELVTDAVTFKLDWQQLRPGETVPEVDFTSQAVLLLMAGEEPTTGYSIHVSTLEEKTDQLVIHYNVNSPAPGTVEAQVLTHPWSMQVIPKPIKTIVFQKD